MEQLAPMTIESVRESNSMHACVIFVVLVLIATSVAIFLLFKDENAKILRLFVIVNPEEYFVSSIIFNNYTKNILNIP